MRVICINIGHKSPIPRLKDYVTEGQVYTVRCEETGFSTYAERIVDAYGFEEIEGLYEKGMFMPLSNLDERLMICLRTKPHRNEKKNSFKPPPHKPLEFTYYPDVMEEKAYNKKSRN